MSEKRKIGRFEAFKATFTGNIPFVTSRLGVSTRLKESDKGSAVKSTMTERGGKVPHPAIMPRLDELNRDPILETAITIKTEMVAGVGIYTEMPEGEKQKDHPNKTKVDEYNETINLTGTLLQAVRVHFEKGFCPCERLEDGKLKLMPPETFFMWRKKTGEVFKYTQEVDGSVVATWSTAKELKDIILFVHKGSPTHPYGRALAECLEDALDTRIQNIKDIKRVYHRLGFPLRVWEADTKEIEDVVYENVTNREPDEDVFVHGVKEGQLRIKPETLNVRIDFSPWITHIDEVIAEGVFAPLLIYLHNATEASATKILEAIDRHIEGLQSYWAREVQEKIYLPMVGKPTPRLMFGQPKTGLEDVKVADLNAMFQSGLITFEQGQDLLKKLGLQLQDLPASQEPQPLPGGAPPPEKPTVPLILPPQRKAMLEVSLLVLVDAFKAKKLSVTEAFHEAERCINATIETLRNDTKRLVIAASGDQLSELAPETEQSIMFIRNQLLHEFRQRILPTGEHGRHDITRSYRVIPDG